MSACCRVPLPISRYCILVAPERPIGTRNSSAVSSVHISDSAGAICAKRHFHAVGILAALADAVKEIRGEFRRRRRIEN